MNTFSIKDLEIFSGIKAHTIRTWEQRFSFLQPQRSAKLRRTYSINELKLLLDVSLLNRNGYKVSQIARMDGEAMNAAVTSMCATQQKQEKAIREPILCMAKMDLECFEIILDTCVVSWGISTTISAVIIPFINMTGLLESDASRTAKPNLLLIEQSIRHKIIMGIERTTLVNRANRVLFFYTRKANELEMLVLQYQLKTAGFTTVFVNAPASATDITTVIAAINPAYIITSLKGKNMATELNAFSEGVEAVAPEALLINVDNSQSGSANFKAISNFFTAHSGVDVLKIISPNKELAA